MAKSTSMYLYEKTVQVYLELQSLITNLEAALQESPQEKQNVKAAIIGVLDFLCSTEGRTAANCETAGLFLLLAEERGTGGSGLPDLYQSILIDMGYQLHDTFGAPAIAENFRSTPEQLLQRAKQLPD